MPACAQKAPPYKLPRPEQPHCARFTDLVQPAVLREGRGGRLQPPTQLRKMDGDSSQHAELMGVFRVPEETAPLPSCSWKPFPLFYLMQCHYMKPYMTASSPCKPHSNKHEMLDAPALQPYQGSSLSSTTYKKPDCFMGHGTRGTGCLWYFQL